MLSHNQMELAEDYLKILQSFRTSKRKSEWRPEQYSDMVDFYLHIFEARRASDPEQKKRLVAKACLLQIRSVANLFTVREIPRWLHANDLRMSLNLLIEFGLDEDWAKSCCRAIFPWLDLQTWHPVFFKVVEWNAFPPPPPEGAMQPDDIWKILWAAGNTDHDYAGGS